MSSFDKLLDRLQSKPNDLKITELSRVLIHFGFAKIKSGKTGGSRIKFFHEETKILISLHNPHIPKTLRSYQLELVLEKLKEGRFL